MPVNSTGSRYSPSTVNCAVAPRFVVTVNRSPVFNPVESARFVSMRAPSRPRRANSASEASSRQSKSNTSDAVAGSIVFRNWLPPGSVRISGNRRNWDAATPGVESTTCCAAAGNAVKLSVWRIRSPWSVRSIAPVNESFRPAAKIATNATRPTPIMRAAAVAAVRAVLRVAFARARRPVVPASASIGAPIARARGRTMKRDNMPTPRNTSTAPSPSTCSASVAPRPPASP